MIQFDRRQFLKTCAVAGVGLEAAAAASPSLSVAHYKNSPMAQDGIEEEAKRLTRKSIEALGGMSRFISKGDVVWVKPNIGWDRSPEQAANTDPDVVAAIVAMCFESGAKKVVVSDNTCNAAQRTFPRSGIQPAAEKAGAQCYFLDQRKFRKMAIKGKALTEWEIYQDVVESDKLINVAVIKHHGLSKLTMGMKNLMGVAGGQRSRFHQEIDKSVTDLAMFLKPRLVVLDAIRVLTANGPQGGNLADVKRKDTIIAGVDQVAVDAYGATLMGLKPEDISTVVEGNARGLGTMNFKSLSPRMIEL